MSYMIIDNTDIYTNVVKLDSSEEVKEYLKRYEKKPVYNFGVEHFGAGETYENVEIYKVKCKNQKFEKEQGIRN